VDVKEIHDEFATNIDRLLGLHGLTAREAAKLIGLSAMALSEWRLGKREPSLKALIRLSALFEVAGDRLVTVPFRDLLSNELSDPDRFDRVEARIDQGRSLIERGKLQLVGKDTALALPWLVSPEQIKAGRKTRTRQ
jgi:transcriptional regulator with XRE-family HTH domain